LRGLSSVGCNRYNYSENDPNAATNPTLSQASAISVASILYQNDSCVTVGYIFVPCDD